jgi:carbonic anhydrase
MGGAATISAALQRNSLLDGQNPFAIILGCSDSRVPAELVFDQGLGDLFVIRVAGNIVAPSQVGSVEFAAARFGTRLVVVLGHSSAGRYSLLWRKSSVPAKRSRATCAP